MQRPPGAPLPLQVVPRDYQQAAYLQVLAERSQLAAALSYCYSLHSVACSPDSYSELLQGIGNAMFR